MHDQLAPSHAVELVWDSSRGTVVIGKLTLEDRTAARFRKPTALRLGLVLWRDEGDQSVRLPAGIVTLAVNGVLLEDPVLAGTVIGDRHYDIIIDTAKLPRVYKPCPHVIEAQIEDVEAGSPATTIRHTFMVVPDRRESDLIVQWYSRLVRRRDLRRLAPVPFRDGDAGQVADIVLQGELPLVPGGTMYEEALRFDLQNSALDYDAPDHPNNVLHLTHCDLSDLPDWVQVQADEGQGLHEPLVPGRAFALDPRLAGNGCHALKLSILVDQSAAEIPTGETVEGTLSLRYLRYDVETGNHQSCAKDIRFGFQVQPRFTADILALDLGTSAISMGVARRLDDNARTALSLAKAWDAIMGRAAIHHRGESDEHLISSDLYWLANETYGIAPPTPITRLPGDRKLTANAVRLPFIKSHVGACRTAYTDANGRTHSVATLLRVAYTRLLTDYLDRLIPPADGQAWQPRRVVVTHPNAYLASHREYLTRQIRAALADRGIADANICAISESDAAIYYFLANRGATSEFEGIPSPPCGSEEVVLCYDMGAGTLDITLRRIAYDASGVPEKEPERHCLLALTTVRGAGVELDEHIARALSSRFELIDAALAIPENREKLELQRDDFRAFPIFEPAADAEGFRRLEALAYAIRTAKARFAGQNDAEWFEVELSTDTEIDFTDALAERLPELLPGRSDFQLRVRPGNTRIAAIARSALIAELAPYLRKHVADPLEAVLGDAKEDTPRIVLVTGRAAQFPGIVEGVKSRIAQLCPGATPHVVTLPQSLAKTVVMRGALEWAVIAETGEEMFSTPPFHGSIGLAIRRRHQPGLTWQRIFRVESGTEDLKAISPKLKLDEIEEIYLLHTSIRNDAMIVRMLAGVERKDEIHKKLEAEGHFHCLHHIAPTGIASLSGYDKVIAIGVRLILPSQRPPTATEDGFRQMRLQITAIDSNDSHHLVGGSDGFETSTPMVAHESWPSRLSPVRKAEDL